jgi:hypothetical protein
MRTGSSTPVDSATGSTTSGFGVSGATSETRSAAAASGLSSSTPSTSISARSAAPGSATPSSFASGPAAAFPFEDFPCVFAGAACATGAPFSLFDFAPGAADVASEADLFPFAGVGDTTSFALATGFVVTTTFALATDFAVTATFALATDLAVFFVAGLAALLATGFSGAGFFAIGFGAVLGAGFAVVRDPRFAAGLPTGFAVAFVAGESAGL